MDREGESIGHRAALVTGHCAGMVDLVALPVWIGIVLIGRMGLEPARAGGLATLFLISVVASALYFAPRLNRINRERFVPAAFALAGLAFLAMTASTDYGLLAAAHMAAGLSVGCGLSLTHGTMGFSSNPHRLASIAFTALGVMSIAFLATVPPLVERFGSDALFIVLACIMFAAATTTLFAFPEHLGGSPVAAKHGAESRLSRTTWFGMAGVSLLALNQAIMFGFLERIGSWHGFSPAQIAGVLVGIGVVNLFPAAIAGMLERRLSAELVMCLGPLAQAVLALAVTQTAEFSIFAIAASLFIAVLIFTHTFAFGFLAREDRSGRAVAATPVMVMSGSALGPLFGGVLAQQLGYGSLGWAAVLISIASASCFGYAVKSRALPVHGSEAAA